MFPTNFRTHFISFINYNFMPYIKKMYIGLFNGKRVQIKSIK